MVTIKIHHCAHSPSALTHISRRASFSAHVHTSGRKSILSLIELLHVGENVCTQTSSLLEMHRAAGDVVDRHVQRRSRVLEEWRVLSIFEHFIDVSGVLQKSSISKRPTMNRMQGFLACVVLFALTTAISADAPIAYDSVLDSDIRDLTWAGTADHPVAFAQSSGNTYVLDPSSGIKFRSLADTLPGCRDERCADSGICNCVEKVVISPADGNVVYLLGNNAEQNWVTYDAGATFHRFDTSFVAQNLLPHPTEGNWSVAVTCEQASQRSRFPDCDQAVFVSRNGGQSFSQLPMSVTNIQWSPSHFSTPKDTLYATMVFKNETGSKSSSDIGNVHFVRIENGKTTTVLRGGSEFMESSTFAFVARVVLSTNEVSLYTSANGYDFYRIELPARFTELSYTLLDSTEESVFINIQHEDCHGHWGAVYVSNSLGQRYSMTMAHNRRKAYNCNWQGDCGVCDFHRVKSLSGVYIANEVANWADAGCAACTSRTECLKKCQVVSRITYDKGGEWEYMTAPTKDLKGDDPCASSPKGQCHLHLHSTTSDDLDDLTSTSEAVGVVLGTGNVGAFLNSDGGAVSTFYSRDAGASWREVLRGAYRTAVLDHGAVLVAVPYSSRFAGEPTNSFLYSWNDGASWANYTFPSSMEAFFVEEISIVPNATSRAFVLQGTKDSKGHAMYIDLSATASKECSNPDAPGGQDSDYEVFYPHSPEDADDCLLGEKVAYTRRKDGVSCYNPVGFEKPRSPTPCSCTRDDFECDYGFEYNENDGTCHQVLQLNKGPPSWCRSGIKYQMITGYRKVADDQCTGGLESQYIGAMIDCPSSDHLGSGATFAITLMVLLACGLLVVVAYQRSERVRELLRSLSARAPSSHRDVRYSRVSARPEAFAEDEDFGLLDDEDDAAANREIDIAPGNSAAGSTSVAIALDDEEDEGDADFNPRKD